jgi:hypothetical protein
MVQTGQRQTTALLKQKPTKTCPHLHCESELVVVCAEELCHLRSCFQVGTARQTNAEAVQPVAPQIYVTTTLQSHSTARQSTA